MVTGSKSNSLSRRYRGVENLCKKIALALCDVGRVMQVVHSKGSVRRDSDTCLCRTAFEIKLFLVEMYRLLLGQLLVHASSRGHQQG